MVNASKTVDILPYKLLDEPLFYLSNIKVIHPEDKRPYNTKDKNFKAGRCVRV